MAHVTAVLNREQLHIKLQLLSKSIVHVKVVKVFNYCKYSWVQAAILDPPDLCSKWG